MSKVKLFDDDSDEEVEIKTENEYAKRYDAWREKEELHKLEQKYGSKALNTEGDDSTDSEDESDVPPEVSEEVEKQFLKTLSLLKTKDPRIYDPNFKCFDDKIEKEKEKEPETKKLTFGDSDDDDDDPDIFSIEKKAEIDNEDDRKHKDNKKDEKIKEFLIGKADHIDDDVEKDLAPLRALWSDPKLNDGEAFLRDYILNKRYLEDGDAGDAADQVRDDEDLERDEKLVEEQGAFERAYNFRFEEPDDQFLKRFPRTMNYIRPKDDRRSKKRAEIRERKEQEKKKKMEEIARLKALKLKEIQEKIAKIKEVTGNQDLAFQEEDIEGDFDPEEHDKRMKALFDEEYYGEADDQKPVFPDLDEELEIENWDNYEREYDQENGNDDEPHCEDKDFNMDADYDPKKAKEDLLEELKRNMGKKRRNRKRKSKLAEILSEEKPKFIPDIDKTYDEYMQEYYKMDCEDVIGGDLPTRFKYREVVPNDFGLTIEEILLADDKELTQWVPLKKIVKYRPENVERSEIKTYQLKSADERLKKKILPSLFKNLPEEPELVVPIEAIKKKKKKKKKKQKVSENTQEQDVLEETIDETQNNSTESPKKKKNKQIANGDNDITKDISMDVSQDGSNENKKIKKKHKKENIESDINEDISQVKTQDKSEYPPEVISSENKTLKKKHRKNAENVNEEEIVGVQETDNTSNKSNEQKDGKKKKKKAKESFNIETVSDKVTPSNVSSQDNTNSSNKDISNENNLKRKLDTTDDSTPKKKKKKNKNKQSNNLQQSKNNKKDFHKFNKNINNQNDKANNPLSQISDERLKAYGLNPKKYRSFLKYKKY